MRNLNLAGTLPLACLTASLLLTGCGEEGAGGKEDIPFVKGGIESEPLPTPKATSGQPLFTILPSSQTGVDLINPIIKDHPMAYLYASAMGCGGVAVGDIDNDGRPDLFFTGGPVANRLYRQTGDLVFEDITSQAKVGGKGAWSTGAAIVDIDNDGDLDIYVCNYDSENQLFLNRGDSTFVERAKRFRMNFKGAGHTPAFCDFDLDGDLDLYLMTNFFYDPRGKVTSGIVGMVNGKPQVMPTFKKFYGITKVRKIPGTNNLHVAHDTIGQPDRLVRNNGDGTFTEISRPSQFRGKGNAALWWDPDEDGRPELYVANDFKDPDTFLVRQSNGSFKDTIKSVVPHITWFSMGTDSADLDGDGRVDLFVADMSGTNHFKQKVSMGAMSDNAEFLNTAVPRQYMRNVVFLNTGTGRFREAAHMTGLANSDWTWTVRLSDFDNDGRVDAYFTNGMAVNLNVADNEAALKALPGETEWAKHQRARTGPLKEQNLAFRNLGDLKFEDVSVTWGLHHTGMSYAAVAADLDRDGDLEIIGANLEEPISIYRNNSSEANRIMVELRGSRSNKRGIGATVRLETAAGKQVRFLTLTRGYLACSEALVHFGLGSEKEIKKLTVLWPSGHFQEFENLESNQKFIITEPSETNSGPPERKPKPLFSPLDSTLSKVSHRERSFDDFSVQPLLPNKLSQLGPGMAWGDIDGDGDDDFYLAGANGTPGQLHRNDGGGKFTPLAGPWDKDTACEDMGALFFDSDSDGDLDLYVVSGGVEYKPAAPNYQDRLYLNDGKGGYTRAGPGVLPPMVNSGGVIAGCDFDADGDLDLFVGSRVKPGEYPLGPPSHLLRNDGGKFTEVSAEVAPDLSAGGLVTSALWSDADGDGKTDLLLTHEWGPVRYLRNVDGKLVDQTKEAGIYEHWGWWNGIAGGDIDHDGDIDYAVTNFGLNTKYHASTKEPVHLFYGDFDGTGVSRCVEAEYEDGKLYPVRGRSCSSNAMPFLLEKFLTFTEFARASLPEIYPKQRLQTSRQFAANVLESGILLNEGKGKFTFRALPHIAQIAPGYGVELCDFDGDGHLDLYIVQNFYSPQAETGRMAGGVSQLLKGDGTGSFTPVDPEVSGLVVPGDAKSLCTPDLDGNGWPDLVIGVNDGKVAVYRNAGNAEGKLLTVRLKGTSGNPTGVGAKVTLTMKDGSQRISEVRAGGGYLSQGPATALFGLGSTGEASKVSVAWADGKSSTLENPGEGPVVIAQPE